MPISVLDRAAGKTPVIIDRVLGYRHGFGTRRLRWGGLAGGHEQFVSPPPATQGPPAFVDRSLQRGRSWVFSLAAPLK